MTMGSGIFSPKGFLMAGGIVLVLLGVVGYLNIFSETAYPAFWLDGGENAAHLALGIVALAALYVPGLNSALAPYYRWIVLLVGVIALFFGIYGFVVPEGTSAAPNTFGISNLESPADNILHLVVAAWAFLAGWKSESSMA